MYLRSLIVAAAAAFSVPLVGQAEAALAASVGVHDQGDHVRLTGPGYTARVDGDGLEFTPLFGKAVERPVSLRATPVAIARGAVTVWARGSAVPEQVVDGARLRRSYGGGVTEVYDARAAGVEQSFELAARPSGDGDLVVRVVIATELPCVAARPDGLRYERDGLGGVTVGAVTGIDARGRRVTGTLRRDGCVVEYVLPGSFVDAASYPLLVDPLFGSAFQVANLVSLADEASDVAFDATNQVFCVAWRVMASATQGEIRAQRVAATGTLLGGHLLVSSSAHVEFAPRVVGVNATDRFLITYVDVAWIGATDERYLRVRSVGAATGTMSNAVVVYVNFLRNLQSFAAGGDSRVGLFGQNENVLIARAHATVAFTDDVHLRLVHVPASGDPTLVGTDQLLGVQGYSRQLTVSRHAGSAGRWLVAWASNASGAQPPYTSVLGVAVNGSGVPCGAVQTLVAATQLQHPAVATRDGSAFAVAWHDLSGSNRIRVRLLTHLGACSGTPLQLGAEVDAVASSLGTAVGAPALEFAQEKYVLAYTRSLLLQPTEVWVKSLDPASCAVCGADYAVETSASDQRRPAICAQWSGASNQGDMTLVAWDAGGAIRARRFEATGGGAVAALGGACGTGGGNVPAANGPSVLGNLSFELSLGTPTAPVLALIVGLSAPSLVCGPCTLVPNLDIVMAGGGPHPIPLPCDLSYLGVQFWTQWLLFAPGGCPILPDFALSAAHRYTITD